MTLGGLLKSSSPPVLILLLVGVNAVMSLVSDCTLLLMSPYTFDKAATAVLAAGGHRPRSEGVKWCSTSLSSGLPSLYRRQVNLIEQIV